MFFVKTVMQQKFNAFREMILYYCAMLLLDEVVPVDDSYVKAAPFLLPPFLSLFPSCTVIKALR